MSYTGTTLKDAAQEAGKDAQLETNGNVYAAVQIEQTACADSEAIKNISKDVNTDAGRHADIRDAEHVHREQCVGSRSRSRSVPAAYGTASRCHEHM